MGTPRSWVRVGRTTLLTGALALSLSPLAVTPALAVVPTRTADPGLAAAGWLAGRVQAGGQPSNVLADAVIAFAAIGAGGDAAHAALSQLEAKVDAYVGTGASLNAGALGKVLLAAAIAGDDVHAFGGHDLEADLRGLMTATGADAGHFGGAQVFEQAVDILALSATGNGIPAPAVAWLAAKQCPDGDFSYDGTCPSFSPDPDSTAIAIQALKAAGDVTALAKAEAWLLAQQASDGSLASYGIPNSSSTAAAGEAYRALDDNAAADKAATFVTDMALGCDASAAFVGAIPWSAGGTTYLEMSTTQAMLGLGAGRLDTLHLSGASATAPTLACPNAPTGATAVAAGHEATVSWTAPADEGSPIASYVVLASPGSGTCAPKPATATTCTVRDLADGKYTFTVVAMNALGVSKSSDASNRVTIDTTAPMPKAPSASLRVGQRLTGTNVPVKLTWSATDALSAVTGYELERSATGGATYAPVTLASPTTTALNTTMAAGATTYTLRVKATDAKGNESAWAASGPLTLSLLDDTATRITYKGSWSTSKPASASGATLHSTRSKGASASITFTGRGVAWVAPKGATRGTATIYLDGRKVGTVSQKAASASRVLVYARSWSASTRHTLRIVAAGTAGHPRIDVDAFVIVK